MNKKSTNADLEKKINVFLLIGLILSLSTVLISFELGINPKKFTTISDRSPKNELSEIVVQTKSEIKLPPPPVNNTSTVIEIVPDYKGELPDVFIDINPGNFILPYYKPYEKSIADIDDSVYRVIEQDAYFPGGESELFKWLNKNIIYPPAAKMAGISGILYVEFIVEKNGSISGSRIVLGSLGGGCEEEAIRVVSSMPKWIPGKQRLKPVRSFFILPINFQLI